MPVEKISEKRINPRNPKVEQITLDSIFNYIREIDNRIQVIDKRQDTLNQALVSHMATEDKWHGEVIEWHEEVRGEIRNTNSLIETIISAFPQKDGKIDTFQHRKDHEERREEKAEETAKKEETRQVRIEIKKHIALYILKGIGLLLMMFIATHADKIPAFISGFLK